MSLRPVLERERDGRRINPDGLVHGVILGDLQLEPHPEEGVVLVNGERWRRCD